MQYVWREKINKYSYSYSLLELANVKLNCKYLVSSIWPKLKQELVEKYIKLGPVLFHII
jgi:hypothetical protein